jgi:uncharacterized protein
MSFFEGKTPWYISGLAFECIGCGRCCAEPEEGYVWLTDKEVAAIAEFLKITETEMRESYVRRVNERLSLREKKPSRDCVFLEGDDLGQRKCKIYSVRPLQCRTWPYWPQNLSRPESWAAAGQRCPGINRGKVVTFNEIETRRLATNE